MSELPDNAARPGGGLADDTTGGTRSAKRQRTEPAEPVPVSLALRNRIGSKFGVDLGPGLWSTAQNLAAAVTGTPALQTDTHVFEALRLLAQTLCVADKTAAFADPSDPSSPLVCTHCSAFNPPAQLPRLRDDDRAGVATVFASFHALCVAHVPPTGPLAVRALVLARRMALHANTRDLLDYGSSAACRWSAAQLASPDRAVRVQASKTLAAYARDRSVGFVEVMVDNRRRLYRGLDVMRRAAHPLVRETCVLVWAQLGMVVAECELEPVLRGLLLHLDGADIPLWHAALAELRALAAWHGRTPNELFEPYWRTTASLLVQHIADQPDKSDQPDRPDKPDVAGAVANLFGTTAAKLACRLQAHAIPEFLFRRELAPVRRIAEFRGDELLPALMDKHNLAAILAYWVQRPHADASLQSLMALLQDILPRLEPASIRDIVGVATVPVLGELFVRLTYQAGHIRDTFVPLSTGVGYESILTLAKLLAGSDSDADADSDKLDDEILVDFLKQHVLGLTTRLSDVHGYGGKKHLCHWIRGIQALEILVKYLGHEIRNARPQVTAFLLDALSQDQDAASDASDASDASACWRVGVRRAAISCWAALVQNVGGDSLHTLVETTFAVVRRNWDAFGEWERAKCKALFAWLLDDAAAPRDGLLAKIDVLPPLCIPELAKSVDAKVDRLKSKSALGGMQQLDLFAQRIAHENLDVVWVALQDAQRFLQHSRDVLATPTHAEKAGSGSAVAHFVRALLDCAAKYNAADPSLAADCLACIGLVGCQDANRLGAVRQDAPFVVVYNFARADESLEFVLYMLEHVLVRAFLSATNSTSQGTVAYAVQTLLLQCGISAAVNADGREHRPIFDRWQRLPELVRVVLAPLLTSRYHIAMPGPLQIQYPVFRPGRAYAEWLRVFVADLLAKTQNQYGEILHQALARVVRGQDVAVAEFLLPYMVVYVVAGGRSSPEDRAQITQELQNMAQYEPRDDTPAADREQAKFCYDAVFRVLEYAWLWLRGALHHERPTGVAELEAFVAAFPPEVLTQRALYCRDYARAVFFLEPLAMARVPADAADASDQVLRRAQAESDLIDIYAQIDDPDCLSGIMSKVGSLVEMTAHRKALLEQKAGRWESATTWHLSDLSAEPDNVDIQARVMHCFLQAGHHDALLARADGMRLAEAPAATVNKVLPLALEAAWATGQWARLDALVPVYKGDATDIFSVGIARALTQLHARNLPSFDATLATLVRRVAASVSYSATSSVQACHEAMLRAHVVTDLRIIAEAARTDSTTLTDTADRQTALSTLVQRLHLLQDVSDKRFLLALQRAAMEGLRPVYGDREISALWLVDARLARKTGSNSECLKAIAHARQLGDPAAEVENARRQWAWGGRHQAIADLRLAIRTGFQNAQNTTNTNTTDAYAKTWSVDEAAPLEARARLLLTRWLDTSGETSRIALRNEYRELASKYSGWEKAHFFLGRHYKKVLESEEALKAEEQGDMYLSGELARYEIETYLRAARYGTKYLHVTLPRILTLWLGLGSQINTPPEGLARVPEPLRERRAATLKQLHRRLLRQIGQLPAYIFYSTLPQLVARINHPHKDVCLVLDAIIHRVVRYYPLQATWSVVVVLTLRNKTSNVQAAERLLKVLCAAKHQELVDVPGERAQPFSTLLRRGVTFAERLIKVGSVKYRAAHASRAVSLRKDMNFDPQGIPPLVVPIARCLTASLPTRMAVDVPSGTNSNATGTNSNASLPATTGPEYANHSAFASDVITIRSFQDEVLILSSLAQPRKLTMNGSDGRRYDILLKPKDDMRTDQRLMEVNAQINQALRKDAEATRRELSIRTYAVTPLCEDCGIIEWVLGLKTLREILRPYYDLRRQQVVPPPPDPLEIQRQLLAAAKTSHDALQTRFVQDILPQFPPVLQEWFMRKFPHPAAWFTARLQFTRSMAVMSMAGAVLGLGDRHCENVLVDQDSGGVMHVDFNCLFEKGRLFQQPETVPFRLTQNMRAAMGVCDWRGPFQRSCELTLQMMRQQEETLLAVLEAFVHDPTLDLKAEAHGAKQKQPPGAAHKPAPAVSMTPTAVIKNIKRRINGLLLEETIPLGVEGQALELIRHATDPGNLASMYIGWSPHW